ncbi:FAD-dependent oxidoreductase [uncultured Clostridium sp.]|uniref:NAD(P)/FAD-dependent oxidoreductase n=1 Tax=uncultured Clostridium sp. TaxID=59620 RepID=UPI0026255E3E|nr:FAD-dependent oxidoreductase [uncultured Clostridium sp.]
MDYDVLILGGGIVGCAVGYELSKYNLNIAIIEKDYDVADDIAVVNTAIVYDGSETSNALMAGLENIGSELIKESCKKFNIPYKTIGSLRLSLDEKEGNKIKDMYKIAKSRGILNVELIGKEQIRKIEPELVGDYQNALYSKNTAIIAPYDLAIAYAEVASDNGVNFRFEEKVLSISKINKGFDVTTNKNKFKCKFVINTIPDEIYIAEDSEVKAVIKEDNGIRKSMNYLFTEGKVEKNLSKIITKVLDDDTFIISSPMINGDTMIGIKYKEKLNIARGIEITNMILPNLKKCNVSDMVREVYKKDEVLIDDTDLENGYIRVTGKHYGKLTITPAIALSIRDRIVLSLNATLKKNFIDKKRESYRIRELSKEEANEIIKLDKRYGNIICACNYISEGEIVDCIRRPLGARTLEGVKKRTGAGFGSCHGSYCTRKIMNILAREMDKNFIDIVKDSKHSRIVWGRIKEFDEV